MYKTNRQIHIIIVFTHMLALLCVDLIRDGGYNSDTAHPLFVCFVAEEKTDIADK